MPETKIPLAEVRLFEANELIALYERYFNAIEDALAGVRGLKAAKPHEFREEMRADAENPPPADPLARFKSQPGDPPMRAMCGSKRSKEISEATKG